MDKTGKRPRNLVLFFIALQFQIMIAAKVLNGVCAYIFYSRGIFDINFSGFVFFLIFLSFETVLEIGITVLFDLHYLKPCQEIIVAADRIAGGDYDVHVSEGKGPKVFNELAHSFNRMADELGSVETLRCDFVNTMSHEFKTPIASISGFAKMLERDDLSEEERREYLEIIVSESERLTELSTNILNLSKLENQTIVLDKAKLNISEEIRLAVVLLAQKIEKKNLDIEFDGEEVYAVGNRELLKQVWINLLDNAIKYSPENGKIGIEVIAENAEAVVHISNGGEPISLEEAEHIFNKFYRSDKTRTLPGNGLGLAIARRIVELHDGNIGVIKSDEEGTIFEVRLPVLQ